MIVSVRRTLDPPRFPGFGVDPLRLGSLARLILVTAHHGERSPDEIAGLEDDDRVEEELEALKAQVGDGKAEDGGKGKKESK